MPNVSGSQSQLAICKEDTYNVYKMDASAFLLHFTQESIKFSPQNEIDQAIMGEEFDSDTINAGTKVDGSFSFTVHPEQLANLLYFQFGSVKSVLNTPSGILFIFYKGPEDSCLLSLVGTNLLAESGDIGLEAPDVDFGPLGILDLSLVANDSLIKLLAKINATTNYTAYLYGTGASADIPVFSETQIKGQTIFLRSIPAGATTKEHIFQPSGISGTMPSFSTCVNKGVESHGYPGVKVSDISLDIQPNKIVTGSATLIGSGIEDDTVVFPAGLIKEANRAFVGFDIKAYWNGVKMQSVAGVKPSIKRSLKNFPEIGSLTTGEPAVSGKGSVEIDLDLYWNTDTKGLRQTWKNGDSGELIIIGSSSALVETGKPYMFIVRCSNAKITDAPVNIGGPDTVKFPVKVKAIVPNNIAYKTIEVSCFSKTASFT